METAFTIPLTLTDQTRENVLNTLVCIGLTPTTKLIIVEAMNQNKTEPYHWENPRICATCALLEPYHEHDGVMYHTCPHAPAEYACITDPHQRACKHYTPKPVKDTI